MRMYRVTVHYLTPSLRQASYEGTFLANSPFEACDKAREEVRREPRRKVRAIESCSCELASPFA
jgi:hypothetical protein